MKILSCVFVSIVLILSLFTINVGAMGYNDLHPTYVDSGDISFYTNASNYIDDYLQLRSNCYGFAMRLHFASDISEESQYDIPYRQTPGEFKDRTAIGKTHISFMADYSLGTAQMLANINKDCSVLGYTMTTLVLNPTSSYTIPSASSDTTKRLVAMVLRPNSIKLDEDTTIPPDYHFFIQNSDDTWSHKPGINKAETKCTQHNVPLTNNNILQHINCNYYNGDSVLFYIDGPGTTDRGHLEGRGTAYVTNIRVTDYAGDQMKTAEPIQSVSAISKSGWINHKGDVDYYLFDVTESGNYTIEMYAKPSQTMTYRYGNVTNLLPTSVPSLSNPSETTMSDGHMSKSVYLTEGRIYCIMVYSSNQTVHEYDRWYVLNIH